MGASHVIWIAQSQAPLMFSHAYGPLASLLLSTPTLYYCSTKSTSSDPISFAFPLTIYRPTALLLLLLNTTTSYCPGVLLLNDSWVFGKFCCRRFLLIVVIRIILFGCWGKADFYPSDPDILLAFQKREQLGMVWIWNSSSTQRTASLKFRSIHHH